MAVAGDILVATSSKFDDMRKRMLCREKTGIDMRLTGEANLDMVEKWRYTA